MVKKGSHQTPHTRISTKGKPFVAGKGTVKKNMNTEEMIKKARNISNKKNAYLIMYGILVDEIRENGGNYYTTPRWIEHEKIVMEAIRNESDRKVRKTLEGLLL